MDSASEEEACARRVLRAQAQPEAISDETIDVALMRYWGVAVFHSDPGKSLIAFFGYDDDRLANERTRLRAALSAALLHIAGRE